MEKNISQLANERNTQNMKRMEEYNTKFQNNMYDIGQRVNINNNSFAPVQYYKFISYQQMKHFGDTYLNDISYPLPIKRKKGDRQIELTEEQYNVAMMFLSGHLWNMALLGNAGTGKTVTTEYIIENLERYYNHQFDDYQFYLKSEKLKRGNLEKLYNEIKIGLTGTMGVTAVNVKGEQIKGETVHARMGIFKSTTNISPEELITKIPAVKRHELQDTDVLIIDECYIMNSEFFELINRLSQLARGSEFTDPITRVKKYIASDYPFGGLRLILVGDPNQLGPIDENEKSKKYHQEMKNKERQIFTDEELSQNEELFFSQKEPEELQQFRMSLYIFETNAWKNSIGDNIAYLTQVMRQNPEEIEFLEFLNKLKMKKLSLEDKKWFVNKTILRDKFANIETDMIKRIDEIHSDTTVLYGTNLEVTTFNLLKLAHLGTTGKVYTAEDLGRNTDIRMEPPYPEKLCLKLGCPFMLLKNMLKKGLYNGSKGYVVGFQEKTGFPYVYFPVNQDERIIFPNPSEDNQYSEFNEFLLNLIKENSSRIFLIKPIIWIDDRQNVKLYNRLQIPGKLDWSSTVHKAQGLTIPKIIVDPSQLKQPGAMYTAFTRVRRLEDIIIFSEKYSKKLRYEENDRLYDELINPQILENVVEFDIICSRKSKENLKSFLSEKNLFYDQNLFENNTNQNSIFESDDYL